MQDTKTRSMKRSIALLLTGALCAGLLISPVGAHVGSQFGHLWKKHIRPKIAAKGKINQRTNPVHWTKLKSVPRAVAKPARLQLKFKNSCAPGSAVRSVTRAGDASCEPVVSQVFYGQSASSAPMATTLTQIKSLPMDTAPAGTYLVTATMAVTNPNTAVLGNTLSITCELVGNGGGSDAKTVTVPGTESVAMSLQTIHQSDGNDSPIIRCSDGHVMPVLSANLSSVTMSATLADTNQVTLGG
jgi:hypothetical protein